MLCQTRRWNAHRVTAGLELGRQERWLDKLRSSRPVLLSYGRLMRRVNLIDTAPVYGLVARKRLLQRSLMGPGLLKGAAWPRVPLSGRRRSIIG